MPEAALAIDRDLLLRGAPGHAPHPLELFVRLESPDESHFYAQGLSMSDFGALYARELKSLDVLITRMPVSLLNPNYWETLSKEAENAVREKTSGIITRSEGDRALIFRSDRVSRGRLLRDGLDVPVELHNGYVFRTSGENLLKLGEAWNGRDRFDWAALSGLQKGSIPNDTISTVHQDLAQSRLSMREETILFAAQEDGLARVIFARRAHLNRAVEGLLRGFVAGAAKIRVGFIGRNILEKITSLADGVGLSAAPERDVTNTGRTVEIRTWLGRTPWGATAVDRSALLAKEKALIYYDSISGIWDVAS